MKTYFFISYIFCAIVLLYYWLIVFSKISKHKTKEVLNIPERPFSIIVAAKNEAENILDCIQNLLIQEYVNFEIIIINDYSTDNTVELINSLSSEKIHVYNNSNENSGKKSAIEFGISKANNEFLVFIDADCKPTSNYWLAEVNKSFSSTRNMVLGHGRFYKSKGFLNKLVRYESLINAIQYFSYSLNGNPYMGVGRNMAYTKSLFNQSNGFKTHKNIKSGDDDLFVNENSSNIHVGIMTNGISHTLTNPVKTFKEYFFQKRRHLQAGTKYKASHKTMLGIYGVSQLFFSLYFFVLLLNGIAPLIVLLVFLIKELIQLYIIKDICKQLQDEDLIKWKLFLETIYIFVITVIALSTLVWKVDRWK